MADNTKKILFKMELDQTAFQRLKTAIADITRDIQKLVATTNGLGLGGGGNTSFGSAPKTPEGINAAIRTSSSQNQGGGKGGGLSAAFNESAAAMKNMANVSKDSLRIMSETMRREVDAEKRSLSELDAKLRTQIDLYQELERAKAGATGNFRTRGPAIDAQMQAAGIEHGATLEERTARAGSLSARESQLNVINRNLYPPTSGNWSWPAGSQGGGPGGPPGGGPGGGGGGGGGGVAALMSAATLMAAVGGGIRTAGLIGSEYMGLYRDPTIIEKSRGGAIRPRMDAIRGGDLSTGFLLATMTRDEQQRLMEESGTAARAGTVADQMGYLGGKVASTAGGAAGNWLLGALGVDTSGGSTVPSGMSASGVKRNAYVLQQTAMAKRSLDTIDDMKQSSTRTLEMMGQETYTSTLASRIGAQRSLGTSGLGVMKKDPVTGQMVSTDEYSPLSNRLIAQGYSIEGLGAARMGMVGGVGRAQSRANADEVMRAQAAGFGGYGDILMAGQRAGAGSAFGRSAVVGGINQAAGVQLGQAIIGSGFDPMGTTSGMGMLGAAQAGMGFTGGIMDFQKVGQVSAGIGLGNQFVGGGLDPFQASFNLAQAIKTKPGADAWSQDYLATGMNYKQMMDVVGGGDITASMRAHGIDRDDVRQQLEGSISGSMLARGVGLRDGPAAKYMAEFSKSGKGIGAYIQGLGGKERAKAVEALGVVAGEVTGQGAEAGIGLIGTLGGMGKKAIEAAGGTLGVGLSGREKESAEQQAAVSKLVTDEILKGEKAIGTAISTMVPQFKNLATFGSQLSTATGDLISSFMRIKSWVDHNIPDSGGGLTRAAADNDSGRAPAGAKPGQQ